MSKTMNVHAAFRRWVKHVRAEYPEWARQLQGPVVVGVSGGADSLALLAAVVKAGMEAHAVIVDHGLQESSAEVAATAKWQAERLSAASATVLTVECAADDEAQARAARYRALGEAALGAKALKQAALDTAGHGTPVLVAHTASDDAEGVLVAIARGSGLDSVAGMRAITRNHPVVQAGASWLGRPLLLCDRAATETACREANLQWWEDPHNRSERYLRSRVRHQLIPQVTDVLGEHAPEALARSARQFRADSDALWALARREMSAVASVASDKKEPQKTVLNCEKLAQQPAALRSRIYKLWLADVGGALTSAHIDAIDNLVANYKGQQPTAIPWTANNSLQWHVEVSPDPARNAEEREHSPTIGDMRHTHRLAVERRDGELRYRAIAR